MLTGAQLTRFTRRGKYLLGEMQKQDETFYWLSHLGMTGRYNHIAPDRPALAPGDYAHDIAAPVAAKHVHVRFDFDDGTQLTYADPRRFGFMDLIRGAPDSSPFLGAMGPEPLGNDFHEAALLAACAGKKTPVKKRAAGSKRGGGLGQYICLRGFVYGGHQSASPSGQFGAEACGAFGCPPFAPFWRAPCKRAARLCAISPIVTASSVISSTSFSSMTAKAKIVRHPIAMLR